MRRLRMLTIGLEIVLLLSLPRVAQSQSVTSAPVTNRQSARRSQGFLDYALGKLNRANTNYGTQIQVLRDGAVRCTVDDLYFWSDALALVVLTCITLFLLLNLRAASKRETTCAVLIAQLWNGRISDRIEIRRRTELYNRLIEAHNAEVERALMADSKPSADEEPAPSKLGRTVERLEKRHPAPSISDSGKPSSVPEATPPGKTSADADLIKLQQNNTLLVRRIEAMKNTQLNLKERLNQTASSLEQERRRNQTLKGA